MTRRVAFIALGLVGALGLSGLGLRAASTISLRSAAARGDAEAVGRWIRDHQGKGETPWERQLLLQAAQAVSAHTRDEEPVNSAAEVEAVYQAIIDSRPDPNDEVCRWIFIEASTLGRAPTVRRLLERGIDPNTRDRSGCTALMFASLYHHLEVVRLLLQHGADVNATWIYPAESGPWAGREFTALSYTREYPKTDYRIHEYRATIRLLEQHGARE